MEDRVGDGIGDGGGVVDVVGNPTPSHTPSPNRL